MTYGVILKRLTGATLCAGGEGVGIGMTAAGITHKWGIEIRDDIAQVGRDNGFNVITADVCAVDPATMEPVDVLHASLPCITASAANQSAEVNEDGLKESAMDMKLARATIGFIETLRPAVFTLENVYGYRNYQSFIGGDKCEGIVPALRRLGYAVDWWHLNAADYGVPQSRKRLILIARRDGRIPRKPQPTHRNPADVVAGQLSLFEQLPVWNGWLSAIADIVDALPESRFAKWQEERLPKELKETLLFSNQKSFDHHGHEYGMVLRRLDEPAHTIRASGGIQNAFLVSSIDSTVRQAVTQSHPPRAFLMGVNGENGNLAADTAEPSPAIAANHGAGKYRAFIVDGKNAGQEWGKKYQDGDEPIHAVTAIDRPAHFPTAYLVDYGNTSREATTLEGNAPSMSVQAWHGRRPSQMPDGFMPGKVVKMTSRALARFQSVPDWYALPDNNALACRVIGNMVPPLLAQRVFESIVEDIR